MASVAELYNQEVLEGHREAVAALRDLLARATDPAERRKLANALLRARPVKLVKDDGTEQIAPKRTARAHDTDPRSKLSPAARARLSSLAAMLGDNDDDDDLDALIDEEIDEPMAESS